MVKKTVVFVVTFLMIATSPFGLMFLLLWVDSNFNRAWNTCEEFVAKAFD